MNIFRLHNKPWVFTYSWQPEPREKKNTKTILSALHQLILKLNLGILNWHQQVRTWFSPFNISSWIVKKHQISLAPHYVEIVIYHDIPTRPVCILLICSYFVCNFLLHFLISSRRYENVRYFSIFHPISFVMFWPF